MPDTPVAPLPTRPRVHATPRPGAPVDATREHRSWPIAIGLGILGTAVIGVVLLWIPHLIIKRLPVGGRELRVGLATVWMLGATAGLLFVGARLGRASRATGAGAGQ